MIRNLLGYPLMALALTACVTINIYFPAAAAEEAARTIVRDVLQKNEADEQAPAAQGDKQSTAKPPRPWMLAFGVVLETLVPSAHAAQPDININTAGIRAIRAAMKARQPQLAPHYRSGAIGFDNKGLVAIRDLGAVPLAQRNQVKKLVADENADRNRLYREIARANGHPEWEAEVRSTFARVWVQEAPSGYWYQDGSGSWRQR